MKRTRLNGLFAKLTLTLMLTAFGVVGFSQISGVKTVGTGGDYGSLTAAFAAITSNTLNGNITLQLTASYDPAAETYPILGSSSASVGSFTVTVYPTVSGLSITSNNATGTINLNGSKNVTIDGRVGGTGTAIDLIVENTTTTGYAVLFTNDATSNSLRYCTVNGYTTSATTGVVVFGTGSTTGNSNNTIANCDFSRYSPTPTNVIYSAGSAGFPNANNTISNNNIADFFSATTASNGILLASNNTAWTISGNSFYQSSVRTVSASVTQTCVSIQGTTGNNYTVTGNFIGGSAPNAAGSPWTYSNASTNIGMRLFGINLVAGTTTASSVQGNVIRNITGTTGTTSNPVFAGIIIQNGSANVGTISGNSVGSTSGTGSITLNYSNTAGTLAAPQMFGIWSTGSTAAATLNIHNNNLGSTTLNGVTTSSALGYEGIIATSGTYNTLTVKFNTVGSIATANSINAPTVTTAATAQQLLRGIDIQASITGGNINVRVDTNTVANMNQNSTLASSGTSGANIRGIVVSPAASNGLVTITGNQVYNISGAGATGPAFSSQGNVAGIVMFASSTTSTVQIYDNVVYGLSGTNSGAVQYAVAGIVTSNATAANVFRNKIYDLKNASTITNASTPSVAAGIWYGASGGAYTMANNMITLGSGATDNVIYAGIISAGNSGGTVVGYYNSIRIMGTAASGALPSFGILRTSSMASNFGSVAGGTTVLFRNNLIDNVRNGGTGKHYAIGNISTSGATGWSTTASNFNILNAPSPTAVVAWGTGPAGTDYSFGGYRTLTGGEASSLTNVAVTFQNPSLGDLHVNMGVVGSQVESSGTTVSGFATDFDGDLRPGPVGSVNGGAIASDIGADEFDGVILDVVAPTISYTLLNNTSLSGGETLNSFATITDLSGINTTTGTRPRLYFKRSTDANTFNDNTSATAGWKYDEANGTIGSPFSFSIDYTKLSGGTGVSIGTNIQYFVVAQDLANPSPNVAINSGTFAAAPASVNLTSAAFPIGGTINSYNIVTAYAGSINVGTSEAITSLTNPNGLFDKLNNGALTGSLTVNITSDLTAETGVVGLNQLAEDGFGGYFLTIKPSGVARTISGTPSTPSLIKLNGTDRVIINGSLTPTGSERSLTISNLSTDFDLGNIPDNCVIHLSSPNSTNGATNNVIKNCIIRGLSNVGTEYGIAQGGSDAGGDPGSGALAPNSNNTYENNLIFASNFGVFANGSSSNPDVNTIVKNNTIGSPVASLKTYYAGFWSQGQADMQITDNNILGVSGNLSGAFAICGIFINSTSPNLIITGNNITDVNNASTTGGATGIRLGAFGATSTNMLIANNTISDIFAPGTAAVPTEINNASGMIITSNVNLASAYKIYFNSINMNTNQTGGNSAAFVVAAGVTLAGALDVRNNSFVTTQTANTRYAIYVGSTGAVFTNINRNNYFATTGGTLGFLTSARTTLAAWQTATAQDANSISADPKYNTAIVLGPLTGSPLIGAGTSIAGITKDQINVTRSSTAPSIGAYELAGDYAAPIITYARVPFTCNTGSFTVTATITDFTGISITPTLRPRIYFSKNNGSFFSSVGSQAGGSATNGTWNFVINAATVGGLTIGDKVSYFVVAQDVTANVNVGTSPVGGFGSDVNTVTAYPPSYDTFVVRSALAPGTYTVGAGGNYTTLTAAITDYNSRCLSGPVVFSLIGSTYSTATGETFPLRIQENSYASATNTLTIRPATGVTATISGSSTDIFVLNGADYVTIDGSNNGTNSRDLTIFNTNTTSGTDAIFVVSQGVGKGASFNTIKNCTIQTGSRGTGANATTVTTYYGIYSGNSTGGQGPDNDNLTITNNFFRLMSIGIFATATSTGTNDNWVINNNTFGEANNAFALSRTGVSLTFTNNVTFNGNTFNNINTSDAGSPTGISLGANVTNATISRNTFVDIQYSGTGSFGARAIDLGTGLAASNITIDHNSIANIRGAGSNSFAAQALAAIRVIGTGGIKMYYNSINMGSGSFAGNTSGLASACVYVDGTSSALDIRNNIFNTNLLNSAAGTARTYAIYSDAASSAFTTINYNNYTASGAQGVLGYIGGSNRSTLAAIVASFGGNANSISVTPSFTSATDLHLTVTGNASLDNKGQVLSGYTTDIDGQTRNIFTPDMGIDEFTSTDNAWIGTVSTQWSNKSNWASGVVPGASIDVTIPAGTPFAPVLNVDASVNNLSIATGTTLGLSTFTFTVGGTISGTGNFVGGTASKLVFTRSGAIGTLNLASPGNIGSITTTGTGASLTLGTATNVFGTLDIKGNTLTTGGNLTLKSNISGTASVAPITGSGSISGNVTVERYIPQNAFRAWRMLSVPTQTVQTIRQAWQENQAPLVNGVPGFGTLITSTTGGNGCDAQTAGNSLLSFANGNPGSWTGVTNTNTPIATTQGYMIFIRGDRSASPTAGSFYPTATTLRTNGPLYQGTQSTVTLPAGQNVLVGNVYASAVDFTQLTRSGVSSFRVWDPKLAGSNNIGGYQTFSASNGYDPVPGGGSYGSTANTRIESGLAFILNSTSGGSVQFTESAKATGSRNVFKAPKLERLQLKLSVATSKGTTELADGATVVFDAAHSNAVDNDDALKTDNVGENIAIVNNGSRMAVEARNILSNDEEQIALHVANLKQATYTLDLVGSYLSAAGRYEATLVDNYLGTKTPVSLDGITSVSFETNGDAKSKASDRFRIVFKSLGKTTVPVATTTESSVSVFPNPVVGGRVQLQFKNKQAGVYQIAVTNKQGQAVYNTSLTLEAGNTQRTLQLPAGIAVGTYQVQVIGANSVNTLQLMVMNK